MIDRNVSFTLEAADVVQGARLATSKVLPIPSWLLLVAGSVVAILTLAFFSDRNSIITDILLPLLGFLLVILALVQYVAVPWQARRHFAQSVALKDHVAFTWDDAGYRLKGERGETRLAWQELHRWSQNDRLILLYHSDQMYHAIPKRILSEEQQGDLMSAITASGLKKR